MIKTDLLVVGTGLAGAIAAIKAADEGLNVTVITKTKELLSGSTAYAQGGIIYKGVLDSPEKLKKDILEAGDGVCWERAVDELCYSGPKLVEEFLLDRFKVDFDRDDNNSLDLTAEGAHSMPRIIHSKDKTGESIQVKVIKALQSHSQITIMANYSIVELLTLSHHSRNQLDLYEKPACFGAFVLNNETCEVMPVFASRTILATGGLGRIYKHTTNPPESTGDGIAIAWRAGARCFNLQYIQFHPTTFYNERDRFLLSESMRGEGAKLIDKNGHEFMKDFHESGSLAPRDIVARGIHQTMFNSGHPCVYLDISHKDPEWVKNRFPTIYNHCLTNGVDISSEPVPVVPAAHYSCGGIGVSLRGRTSIQRLYAVGEVACTGVHGANRLASTSLLEAVVWGYNAGKDAAATYKKHDYFPPIYEWEEEKEGIDPALIAQDWQNIKSTMWNYVGLIRTKQRLHRAHTIFRHLQTEIEEFYRRTGMTKELVELRNGVQTAIAVTAATMEARQSRGAHYLKK